MPTRLDYADLNTILNALKCEDNPDLLGAAISLVSYTDSLIRRVTALEDKSGDPTIGLRWADPTAILGKKVRDLTIPQKRLFLRAWRILELQKGITGGNITYADHLVRGLCTGVDDIDYADVSTEFMEALTKGCDHSHDVVLDSTLEVQLNRGLNLSDEDGKALRDILLKLSLKANTTEGE